MVPPDSYIVTQIPKLSTGESEVIALGLDRPGSLVLMDDRSGTSEAVKRGRNVVGTLALLDRARLGDGSNYPRRFAGFRQRPSGRPCG